MALKPSARPYSFLLLATILVPLGLALAVNAAPTRRPAVKPVVALSYNRDIRPILAENCFSCHGPDSAARKAGLRLDRFADATRRLASGNNAIVPGDPLASRIIERILKPDTDSLRMPPIAGHDRLRPEQVSKLIRWIAAGAVYEPHWAYIPPRLSALPSVKNTGWVRNPIDRFVLARLESVGLSPAPEADRRTLARRLSLDLTGLPPTPAEVEQFVADKSPNAYEKLVDYYLSRPTWGEHRGRYWLDAARYADTHGIHFDNYREIWSYRDWVIAAFNANKPFNQFGIEQIAGDLLPNSTMEQKIASGYLRCNITTNEGGSIDEEVNVMYARERTEATTGAFMATTAGCAVCHDHKFDPLSQKEMYSLSAYFNNLTQKAMDGNIRDTPPVIRVPRPEDRVRWEALATEKAKIQAQIDASRSSATAGPGFMTWANRTDAPGLAAMVPADHLRLRVPLDDGQGKTITTILDGASTHETMSAEPGWDAGQIAAKAFVRKAGSTISLPATGDFENSQSFTYSAWIKLNANTGGAIMSRMDNEHDYRGWDMWVEGNKVGTHIISKWPGDAIKVVTREPVPAGEWHHVAISYDGSRSASGVRVYVDGTLRETDTMADALKGSIRTTVPFKIGQRNTDAGVDGVAIQEVRLYDAVISPDGMQHLARRQRMAYLLTRWSTDLSEAERHELFLRWLDVENQPLMDAAAKLATESNQISARGTTGYVAQERPEAPMAYVLFRGEYDKRREAVTPATPAFLPKMPSSFPKNRLGLAQWLFLPENPLTARVTVNRFWQELFGTGIVRTSEDFGIAGEQPSHPELLDYLAVTFRQSGWDVKRLFKTMVMSATYRQAAVTTPLKRRIDPANRLLAHGPRFRMDAEMVRDYALATSGLLVAKQGGPSVRPYQPDGVWESVAMIGSDTRDYKRDMGENLYRRSMYTFWKRSAPPASLDIFNAPSREHCTLRRERTNTPLQALVTLNDVQFVEAARVLAQRTLNEGGSDDIRRLDFVSRRLLARPLNTRERMILELSLSDLSAHYHGHPEQAKELIHVGDAPVPATQDPAQVAAWTMLINEMMNLDEVLVK